MNYIGTDPREGAKVIASSDISSSTASVTFDSIFDTNSMYFAEMSHFLATSDNGSISYTWRNGGSDDAGTTNRSTQYISVNTTTYANSDVNTTDSTSFNSYTGITGDVSEYETASLSSFFVPNTTNEKYWWGETIGWYPNTEALMGQYNSSYSDATAQDGIKFGSTAGNINRMKTRIYKYPEHKPSVLSLKQTLPSVSYVKPKYIGQIRSGQGMVELASYTSSGGESSIDFTDIFTNKYDRYYFYLTNCRPATDKKNLQHQWIEADGTVDTGTYYTGYRSIDSNGGTGTNLTSGQSLSILMNNVGSDSDETGHMYAWCDNPNPESTALGKSLRFRSVFQMSSDNSSITRFFTGQTTRDVTTAFTGIKFYWSSGNWEEGTITILGLQR
tara:strand:- start:431 stop:1591 length:1161 start_codon:yes stop_codon:yes gene_type:complete